MRPSRTPTARAALAALAASAAVVALAAAPTSARGQTATYLDFDGLTGELRSLVDRSDVATMRSVGTSREGRDIWVVELGSRSGASLDERPAVLVVGNLEGDHLVGSHLALEIVRYFVEGGEGAGDVLDDQVVYVFPRVNPDGAEAMFNGVEWGRRTNAFPYDDDNDGRTDEDGPEDLNGDGVITVMRVADPSGRYRIFPGDERLMQRADPARGEQGGYALYLEGVDSDGDGFLNEDGPGGVDLNRNFQHAYPYWKADAGLHMVSEPESRALMDFVVDHRNIGAVLAFGLTDNLVTPPDSRGSLASPTVLDLPAFAAASNADVFDVGIVEAGGGGFRFFFGGGQLRGAQPGRDNDPGSGRRPATTVDGADREYFETVSDAYREITGIEEVGIHREPEGAFFQYGYFQFGVPSFSTPGWGLPAATESEQPAGPEEEGGAEEEMAGAEGRGARPAGGPGPRGRAASDEGGFDARLLGAMDAAGIDAFVPWSEHQHPELGTVEIGGFRPYAVTNPPPGDLRGLGRAHGEFVVRLAGMLPRVRIVDTEVTAHGGGIYTVEAEVENAGYFPTALQHGLVARSVEPTLVQIQVDPDAIVTGDPKSATVRRLEGSRSRESVRWLIRGSPGQQVEIRTLAQKGGTDSATVTLR